MDLRETRVSEFEVEGLRDNPPTRASPRVVEHGLPFEDLLEPRAEEPKPRLLRELSHRRVVEALPRLEDPAGQRPEAAADLAAPFDQEMVSLKVTSTSSSSLSRGP